MRTLLLATLVVPAVLCAADADADLVAAARKGQIDRVRALLTKGANVDGKDKDGRTPLMWAARNGHAETVTLLLERGAKPDERDREGLTAYALAVLSTSNGRGAVLKVLPHPPFPRVTMDVTWAPENLYTSCFVTPQQLRQQVAELKLDIAMATELRDFAAMNGRGVMEFVADGGDGVVHVKVRPEVSCVTQQSADNVNIEVDLRVERGAEGAIQQKTIGGGLKGRARPVTSQAQYGAVFAEWVKAHVASIYWAAVEAWLRTP
jgi:hypothetical protein